MSKHPIADRAEVAIDFPDKAYMGSFTRHSSFEAGTDSEGVLVKLVRGGGEKRVVEMHLHYYLFADILAEVAGSLAKGPPMDEAHRRPLLEAARHLVAALEVSAADAGRGKPA